MNKTLIISLAVIGGIVLGSFVLGAGFFLGRAAFNPGGFGANGMMRDSFRERGNFGMGYGKMGGNRSGNPASATPITVEQAKQAVEGYLQRLNNSDLQLSEIMVFDNNAYARITEKSTGIGAMELLVDPASLVVYPEQGPNMMWNQKYGHMRGQGMMGGGFGMMGKAVNNSTPMTFTPEDALKIAQQYLDQQFPGYQTSSEPDPFYGYYTIEILKDGKPVGMLSVNGTSGEVFLHTWHGNFIEMWE
jgi:hypothetical protein